MAGDNSVDGGGQRCAPRKDIVLRNTAMVVWDVKRRKRKERGEGNILEFVLTVVLEFRKRILRDLLKSVKHQGLTWMGNVARK